MVIMIHIYKILTPPELARFAMSWKDVTLMIIMIMIVMIMVIIDGDDDTRAYCYPKHIPLFCIGNVKCCKLDQ